MQDDQSIDRDASAMAELLRHKAELEFGLQSAPGEAALRAPYFDHLAMLAASHTGLSHALLPELTHPLYFRAATPDVSNLTQIFRDGVLDIAMDATPRRILVIGAYAGYGAVWLSRRHPAAEIACVEPMPSNLRLLLLNTGPWPRIRVLGVAAWHGPARLGVASRLAGDWAVSLQDCVDPEDAGVPGQSVAGLLAALGWSHVDLLLCDAGGAEAAVFADPFAPWLRQLDAARIQLHAGLAPSIERTVAECFPSAFYEHRRHGEAELFLRRSPLRTYPAGPAPLRLISAEPGLAPLQLQALEPVPWSFFVFDGTSCQLHPNAPGQPPARAIFPRVLQGQTLFGATVHHAGPAGAAIAFTLILQRADCSEVLRAERIVSPRERAIWSVPLPAPIGPHQLVLQTAMAPGATNNNNAWARWLDPMLS